MSKILKRPMFRKGGQVEEGVMSLAAPRQNYQEAGQVKTLEELLAQDPYGKEVYDLAKAAYGRDVQQERRDVLSNLLIRGGLGLVSGEGAGKGTLGAIATAFKKPTEQALTKMQELKQDPAAMLAAKAVIGQRGAERLKDIEYKGKLAGERKDRIEVIQKQEDLSYPAAERLYDFQENADAIEKAQGLPIGPRGGIIIGSKKRGKVDYSTFAKNATPGIYYDPDYNVYVRIEGGTASVIDNPLGKYSAPKIDTGNIITEPQQSIEDIIGYDENDPFSGGMAP